MAAFDPRDSVGILDRYFPKAHFFTEFERFDRHLDKLNRCSENNGIDFISICSPNYLHDSHIRFALRSGANVICEKPVVLNPWNIEGLMDMEKETGGKVNTILQLRVHPTIKALKEKLDKFASVEKKHEIDLTYITSRGRWYLQSWKGDQKKSGGIATNIGVHFFDMLHFLFGESIESRVNLRTDINAAGYLEFKNARVRWFLSIDSADLPTSALKSGQSTFRSIEFDGEEIEFSEGFTDLHTSSYIDILSGHGFGLEENRKAIETVSEIRDMPIKKSPSQQHPFVK